MRKEVVVDGDEVKVSVSSSLSVVLLWESQFNRDYLIIISSAGLLLESVCARGDLFMQIIHAACTSGRIICWRNLRGTTIFNATRHKFIPCASQMSSLSKQFARFAKREYTKTPFSAQSNNLLPFTIYITFIYTKGHRVPLAVFFCVQNYNNLYVGLIIRWKFPALAPSYLLRVLLKTACL